MSEQAAIAQRDIHFDLDGVDIARWHGGDPYVTQLMNAMSLLFPEGERFFIRSVRACAGQIDDPALSRDIRGFIGQEAMHGREHQVYNDRLAAAGYPVRALEARLKTWLDRADSLLPPVARLAGTTAAEHLTAIMAHALLSTPGALADADPRMAALWRWHAVEETEHKAVAFDVHGQVSRSLPGYLRRCLALLESSLFFWIFTLGFYRRLLRQDGLHRSPRGWGRMLWFFFGRPGPLRRVIPLWLAWFRPGFHPWDHDNRDLLSGWQAGA